MSRGDQLALRGREFRDYDHGARLSQRIFAPCGDSIGAMRSIYSYLLKRCEDRQSRRQLTIAFNRAAVGAMIRSGHDEAASFLEHLIEEDSMVKDLSELAGSVGLAYDEHCMKRQTLVAPSEIDDEVFSRWVPSSPEWSTYLCAPSLVVTAPLENRVGADVGAVFLRPGQRFVSFYIGETEPIEVAPVVKDQELYPGVDAARDGIREGIASRDMKGTVVVHTESVPAMEYLVSRYLFDAHARKAELRGMGF